MPKWAKKKEILAHQLSYIHTITLLFNVMLSIGQSTSNGQNLSRKRSHQVKRTECRHNILKSNRYGTPTRLLFWYVSSWFSLTSCPTRYNSPIIVDFYCTLQIPVHNGMGRWLNKKKNSVGIRFHKFVFHNDYSVRLGKHSVGQHYRYDPDQSSLATLHEESQEIVNHGYSSTCHAV